MTNLGEAEPRTVADLWAQSEGLSFYQLSGGGLIEPMYRPILVIRRPLASSQSGRSHSPDERHAGVVTLVKRKPWWKLWA